MRDAALFVTGILAGVILMGLISVADQPQRPTVSDYTSMRGAPGRKGEIGQNGRFYTYSTFWVGDKYLGSWVESK